MTKKGMKRKVWKKRRKPSIRTTILKLLSDGKEHKYAQIKRTVAKIYRHPRGPVYTEEFLPSRVSEAVYKLQHYDKRIIRTRRGYYKLRKKK